MKVSTRSGVDRPVGDGADTLVGGRLRRFQVALSKWYGPRARPLRIRATREPWAVLVSEVMAQQTQIARVDEAWVTFLASYPTPAALAAAPTADVLRAWAGLGYNRRAVNLQRAAIVIEAAHGGRVPDDIEALVSLPGVGPYTARAVAALAFGQPVAPVDTNVRRVVTRVVGRALSGQRLQAAADALVMRSDVATWTHASMELGATVCVARRPRCDECPVSTWCASKGAVKVPAKGRSGPSIPFEATSRWLRGRIVAELRVLEGDGWTRLPASMGQHGREEIETAVAGLERDGLVERGPQGVLRLPSGTT